MKTTKLVLALAAIGAAGLVAGMMLSPSPRLGAQTKERGQPARLAQAPGDANQPPAGPGGQRFPGGPGFGGGQGGPGFPGGPGAPGGFRPMMFPTVPLMVTSSEHVYILRGNTLYQFSAKDLKLLNKATLPDERPRLPAGGGASGRSGAQRRPE